jgi:hypothetical protein
MTDWGPPPPLPEEEKPLDVQGELDKMEQAIVKSANEIMSEAIKNPLAHPQIGPISAGILIPECPLKLGQRVQLRGNASRQWIVHDLMFSIRQMQWEAMLKWPDERSSTIQVEALEVMWDEELGDTLAHLRDVEFPSGPSVALNLDKP